MVLKKVTNPYTQPTWAYNSLCKYNEHGDLRFSIQRMLSQVITFVNEFGSSFDELIRH